MKTLLTITINAAGRLIDAENKHILKEISIGGETSENAPIYKALHTIRRTNTAWKQ